MSKKSEKILGSKQEIMDYIGCLSDHSFKKWIKEGMPALRDDDRRWIAHADNIDEFFKARTRVSMRKVIDTIGDL